MYGFKYVSFQLPEESSEINELTRRVDELGRELVTKEEQVHILS